MRQLTKTTCKQLLRWNILLVTDHTQTLLHRLASDRYTFFFASFLLIFVVARQSSFNQIYAQIIFIRELGDEINSENKKAKTKKSDRHFAMCSVCVCVRVCLNENIPRAEQSRAEQHKRTEEEVLNRNFLSRLSAVECVGVVLRPSHEFDANAQIIPRWGNAK